MTVAFKGGHTLKRGDGAGTEVFTAISEVKSLSGLGKTNSLIDVTNFDSGNTKEYIAGLADGQEITFECNAILDDAPQIAIIADVDSGLTTNYEYVITDGTIVNTFSFAAVSLAWVLNPAQEDANTYSFTVKITGAITLVTT